MRFFWTVLVTVVVLSAPARAEETVRQDFHVWLKGLRHEAVQSGISEALVAEALPDTLEPNDMIVRLDRKQPEGSVTFERYKRNVITERRLRDGRSKALHHRSLLREVSAAYGVEPEYIVALWGIETSFGRNTGGFETIPALVTLAYEGRRGSFFRQELLKALRIVDEGNISLSDMKGSWAGAMGQCQFMPTSFEKYAQDFDKDGRRDIWTTEADVFASAAQYLSASGWKKGQPWGHRVILPKSFDNNMIGISVQKSLKFWHDAGVRFAGDKKFLPAVDELVSVIQPGGEGYKAYIVSSNYRILMKWNTSTYFATAVGLFSEGLRG